MYVFDRSVATETRSVQICEIAESGMLDGTGDERVPETDFGFNEQIEERLPDVWESEEARMDGTGDERVPETDSWTRLLLTPIFSAKTLNDDL
ncbi:hypothetical protein OROGR_026155 [Orobanche gracilis]